MPCAICASRFARALPTMSCNIWMLASPAVVFSLSETPFCFTASCRPSIPCRHAPAAWSAVSAAPCQSSSAWRDEPIPTADAAAAEPRLPNAPDVVSADSRAWSNDVATPWV
jgi:hypothetical protein